MSQRFTEWTDAHQAAVKLAKLTNHDVAIRAVKEYGKPGYNVSIASVNDSDYARAEIVRPTDPGKPLMALKPFNYNQPDPDAAYYMITAIVVGVLAGLLVAVAYITT